jgi:hypothetical protein
MPSPQPAGLLLRKGERMRDKKNREATKDYLWQPMARLRIG